MVREYVNVSYSANNRNAFFSTQGSVFGLNCDSACEAMTNVAVFKTTMNMLIVYHLVETGCPELDIGLWTPVGRETEQKVTDQVDMNHYKHIHI